MDQVAQGLNLVITNLARAESGVGRGAQMVQKAFGQVGISLEDVNAAWDGTERDAQRPET